MSENNNPTYHGIYLSGNFDIEEKLSPNHGWRNEYRAYVTYIGCAGLDQDQRLSYGIKAKGYSSPSFMLSENHIYFLRGSFFPSKSADTDNDQFLFEGSDACLLSASEGCVTDLVDSVGVTSLGFVVRIHTIVEKCCNMLKKSPSDPDPKTTVLTVEHADYHPIMKSRRVSRMEYLIRPSRDMAGIAASIVVGSECHFHGFIKDFNQETNCYVVIKVYLTTGFQQQPTVPAIESGTAPGPTKKPPKFMVKKITARADFPEDKVAMTSKSDNKVAAPCELQLPPSPGPSGEKSGSSGESPSISKSLPAPTKKRARYQPKRNLPPPSGEESGE
ncbi:uncharacterized protein MELLADRAFT_95138 [Melampsora larici-populina 98AG31]|uniref:Uncharacterized protein n=1 Tax=Melampsora larici-populina (strain 98AG31 / pathotype 3-4-7) TaxID=747676 RepID=F4RC92_MELLP|nr:uncharacterized protein MELLADRAFT_95138 [Melampsora larici-populina 98AG31]EGG09699.1 hypothetical protein MELLADRAFT_95138 [Melampsora larici-populina 98AG31]